MTPTLPPLLPKAFATLHHDDGYFTMPAKDKKEGMLFRTPVYTAEQMEEYGEQCARAERDALSDQIRRLQKALTFWLPYVPEADHPLHQRVGDDAYLLVGYDGPADEPSAFDLGYVSMATPPAVEARVPDERAAFDSYFRSRHDLDPRTDTTNVGGAFEPWKAWKARAALSAAPAAPGPQAEPDMQKFKNMLSRYEHQWHRMGELWERCQGKAWPEKESEEFARLRDESTPDTRLHLLAMFATQPPTQQASEQPAEPKQAIVFDEAAERQAAADGYAQRFPRKSERTEEGQAIYGLGWWDRAWKAAEAAPQQASAQGEQAQQASAQPTQAAKDVLDCPFCGSSDISDGEMLTEESDGTTYTQSECKGCGAIGPKGFLNRDVADYGCVKAIAAWNRRASNTGQEKS